MTDGSDPESPSDPPLVELLRRAFRSLIRPGTSDPSEQPSGVSGEQQSEGPAEQPAEGPPGEAADQPSEGQSEEPSTESPAKQGMGCGSVLLIILGISVVIGVLSSIGDDDESPTRSVSPPATDFDPPRDTRDTTGGTTERGYTENDPEYQLAAIDGAGLTRGDIAPYDRALDRAEDLCTEDRRLIADMTVQAVQEVSGETNLSMLRALGQSVPDEAAPMDCAEVYASIIMLMREG